MERRIVGVLAEAAIIVSVMGLAPAEGALASGSDQTITISTPMRLDHYDAQVAAANGYEVITRPDGSQTSIPVTEEARRAVRFEAEKGTSTVEGPCGTSFITITKGISSIKKIATGYDVAGPVTSRGWAVTLYGTAGIHEEFYPNGSDGGHWRSGLRSISYGSGGFGNVTPGSFVVKQAGAVCFSGSPGTSF